MWPRDTGPYPHTRFSPELRARWVWLARREGSLTPPGTWSSAQITLRALQFHHLMFSRLPTLLGLPGNRDYFFSSP